jgi:hypothetical protein
MTEERDDHRKVVPFPVFQAYCGERRFVYAGVPGKFNVSCKLRPDRCNHDICPIWNSDRVHAPDSGVGSLRAINLRLKNKEIKNGFNEQMEAHGIKQYSPPNSGRLPYQKRPDTRNDTRDWNRA